MSAIQGGASVFQNQRKIISALLCGCAVLVIGDLDYVTGYEISLLTVYILPIGVATISVGAAFATFLAITSIAISVGSSLWAGIPQGEIPIMVLNAAIALAVFLVSIRFLVHFKRHPQMNE
jgi:hypothetical protein